MAGDETGRRALAVDLVDAALAAVEAKRSTESALGRAAADGNDLAGAVVVALGKASMGMAEAAVATVRPRRGLVLALDVDDGARVGPLEVRAAEHPVSGDRAIENGRALFELAASVREGETVLCLVSGGGSAMAEAPVTGVDARLLVDTGRALLASGAPIEVVNLVRRRMSRLKGGGLAAALAPARVVTVVISDAPGSPPSVVASGPTLSPHETVEDLETTLARHALDERLPQAALVVIRSTSAVAPATEGPVYVAADNETARAAAVARARALGLSVVELAGHTRGEARDMGAQFVREAAGTGADVVVWGGETTVTLPAPGTIARVGRGGRNQELVLGARSELERGLVLSIGTDGVDGTSGAAGALLDGEAIARASRAGLDAERHLAEHDADAFFAGTATRIVTGATGTNVADVSIYLR